MERLEVSPSLAADAGGATGSAEVIEPAPGIVSTTFNLRELRTLGSEE